MRILNYILNSVPYILLSLLIVLPCRLYFNKRLKKQGKQSSIAREVSVVLFILYYVGVASQTVIPKVEINIDGSLGFVRNFGGSINLIPFHQILVIIDEVFQKENYSYFLINILGNICFFIPLGFALPLLWKCTHKAVIVISFVCAILLECMQLLFMTGRTVDIDDVIIYMVGAYIGFALYSLCNRLFPMYILAFKIHSTDQR